MNVHSERLLDIFRRKGGAGVYTKPFPELPLPVQETLFSKIRFSENEFPLIGSYADASQWLILTTDRLLWESRGSSYQIFLKDILEVGLDSKELHSRQILLNDASNLVITTTKEECLILTMGPGNPLCALWNVLLQFVPSKGQPFTGQKK